MRLIPVCDGQLCGDVKTTTWSTHAHEGSGEIKIAHKKLPGLSSPPSRFVVHSLTSHSTSTKTRDPMYTLKALIEIQVQKDVIKEDYSDEIRLNSVPFMTGDNSECFVQPYEGYAVETTFNITCVGWQDEDKPLKYEFRYNTIAGLVINNPKKEAGFNILLTKLPIGDRFQNFQFPVDVHIKDALGDFAIKRINVKVGIVDYILHSHH